jgi:hypothetical protein
MIMLSNATYPAYDAHNAAGWSHAIGTTLLRNELGFTGVTITDSLSGTAHARGVSATSLAIRAAHAGTDMVLLTGSEASTAATFTSMLAAAEAGTIPLVTLQASYNRIAALKASLVAPPVDTTPPTVSAPTSRLYAPSTLGTATTPVLTAWSASDPCAISSVTLRRQSSGGAFATQTLSSPRAVSIRQSLRFATTFRYAARATDGAGRSSAFSYGAVLVPWVSQQGSGVSYGGTWHTVAISSASGGSVAYSTARGASASLRFTGSSVSWVAARGPGRGSAAVYVDGIYRTTVSLASTVYRARQVAYAINWSASGVHTLRIVNLGTAGHPRVDIDAFVRLTPS